MRLQVDRRIFIPNFACRISPNGSAEWDEASSASAVDIARRAPIVGSGLNALGHSLNGVAAKDGSNAGVTAAAAAASAALDEHDSDTGLESDLSSTDVYSTAHLGHFGLHHPQAAAAGVGSAFCTLCGEQEDQKRLEDLVDSVERLKTEKGDLLQVATACKGDIKKLKQR